MVVVGERCLRMPRAQRTAGSDDVGLRGFTEMRPGGSLPALCAAATGAAAWGIRFFLLCSCFFFHTLKPSEQNDDIERFMMANFFFLRFSRG